MFPAVISTVQLSLLFQLSIPHSSLQLTLPFKNSVCVLIGSPQTSLTRSRTNKQQTHTQAVTHKHPHTQTPDQFTLSCSATLTPFPATESLEVQDGLPVFWLSTACVSHTTWSKKKNTVFICFLFCFYWMWPLHVSQQSKLLKQL